MPLLGRSHGFQRCVCSHEDGFRAVDWTGMGFGIVFFSMHAIPPSSCERFTFTVDVLPFMALLPHAAAGFAVRTRFVG